MSYSFVNTLSLASAEVPQESLALVNRWLSCIYHRSVSLSRAPIPFDVGQQHDSHSCGVAVLSSMAHFVLSGGFPSWSQSTASEHRLRWALLLSYRPLHAQTLPLVVNLDNILDDTVDIDSMSDNTCIPSELFKDKPTLEIAQHDLASFSLTPPPSTAPRQLIQTTLPFKLVPPEERSQLYRLRSIWQREEDQDMLDRMRLLDTQKQNERRIQDCMRKRAERKRKRIAQKELGISKRKEDNTLSISAVDRAIRHEISALSRPFSPTNATAARQAPLQGSSRLKTPTQPTQRINWCHPLIWPLIEKAAIYVGYPWSPQAIINRLLEVDPKLFRSLRPQRISQWQDHAFPDELKWKTSHERSIKAGIRPTTSKQPSGIFHNRPDLADMIERKLLNLRNAGMPLGPTQIRGFICGVLKHHMPELFTRPDAFGRTFRCSERFVRHFLSHNRGWSVRKGTRAAQKLPPNYKTELLHAFLCLACVVRDKVIPASCIVNADQTQVLFNPGDGKTWNPSGARQVNIIGADDKRAFTLLVAASAFGNLLPFQAIYAGKSTRSLPHCSSSGFLDATKHGFRLEFSGTESYWANFTTMCDWVSHTLAPYFREMIKANSLPVDQRCMLLIDCWSVHKSLLFRLWLKENFSWIIMLYIPANCTGLFQPCDVGLQRILKLAIRNSAHSDIMKETLDALESGVLAEQIVNNQTLWTLRNRSLQWIVDGYDAINDEAIVKKAFSLCAVPGTEFNLSYDSLTSRAALRELASFSQTNAAKYHEFTLGGEQLQDGWEEDPEEMRDVEDGDGGCTVSEVSIAVLRAATASEAMRPIHIEDEPEFESEDDSIYRPCASRPRSILARANPVLRRSSRRRTKI
ncbi:DDE superfamily endonuclease [Ceratobasidium sp. AG-Ba]|nr:DDE superfamily endonuclease [Ceratobasidium sp. AG-Ba]